MRPYLRSNSRKTKMLCARDSLSVTQVSDLGPRRSLDRAGAALHLSVATVAGCLHNVVGVQHGATSAASADTGPLCVLNTAEAGQTSLRFFDDMDYCAAVICRLSGEIIKTVMAVRRNSAEPIFMGAHRRLVPTGCGADVVGVEMRPARPAMRVTAASATCDADVPAAGAGTHYPPRRRATPRGFHTCCAVQPVRSNCAATNHGHRDRIRCDLHIPRSSPACRRTKWRATCSAGWFRGAAAPTFSCATAHGCTSTWAAIPNTRPPSATAWFSWSPMTARASGSWRTCWSTPSSGWPTRASAATSTCSRTTPTRRVTPTAATRTT